MALRRLTRRLDHADQIAGTVTLRFDQRRRSRLRTRLDDGGDGDGEIGVFLPRGTVLRDGDLLGDGDERGAVRVRAAAETVSTVRAADLTSLARACYHLGNRHVPVQVGDGWARYPHDHVLDDMVRAMGLAVVVEEAPFEPEVGAYGGHRHGVGDVEDDEHAHDHGHAHDHDHGHDEPPPRRRGSSPS
jgi:urease accessory protein